MRAIKGIEMKAILVIGFIVLSFVSSAFAQQDLGQQIQVYVENKAPKISTIFAADQDKFWVVTLSLWASDLKSDFNITTLSWNVYDSKSEQYIQSWKTLIENSAPTIYPGTLAFTLNLENESEILTAIKNQKSLKLILSVDQDLAAPIATHFVDIGAYCTTHPENFMNLTTGQAGCE